MIPADDPFFVLHQGLRREGPGTDATTRDALRRLPPLPERPVVLDLGCGPGGQTLVVAETLRTVVTGVDLHAPFLRQLEAAAGRRGLAELIRTRREDMRQLSDPADSVDLIWSEGSAYAIGFGDALALWRRVLKPGGLVVVSELAWLVPPEARPKETQEFWAEAYPAMTTPEANERTAVGLGYQPVDRWVMAPGDWWPDYYTPLRQRCQELMPAAEHDPALMAVVAEQMREIEVFAASANSCSYVFHILRRR
ncbi:class I SAM-dependent methyltransferase [Caenispirillum bisanense]|uniref:SAM-dependent methyltransferase n=1 Tax=Caenispirillum bisanense TaxID=414052 RepID=UPI0031D29A6F